MKTLYLYDGDTLTKKIAVMISSMVSMGYYAAYDQTVDWQRYGRVVFIMGPEQRMAPVFIQWREKTAKKSLVFLYAGVQPAYMEHIIHAAEAQLEQKFLLTAFVSEENTVDDAITAARHLKEMEVIPMADAETVAAMESFLHNHNTGVLSTGSGQDIRATPIEYLYYNKKLYFFSEGGEKFINLYRNPHAAFAVFDPFTDLQHLGGLQLEGTVRFIEPDDTDYDTVAAVKGIAKKRLSVLPVFLHIIELSPSEVTFVWAGYSKMKKSLRQVYRP